MDLNKFFDKRPPRQIENEYGFCGASKVYLRALAATTRRALGDNVMLFTTDPPQLVERGSLPGDELFTYASQYYCMCKNCVPKVSWDPRFIYKGFNDY